MESMMHLNRRDTIKAGLLGGAALVPENEEGRAEEGRGGCNDR